MDESDFLLFPPLRATWCKKGHPYPVLISGRNQKSVLFAAFEPEAGRIITSAMSRQTSESFRAFLSILRQRYRRGKIILILDSDSSHTAAQSRQAADKKGFELIFLPYRSPHLNPVEHLWKYLKTGVCANHQFPSIKTEMQEVSRFIHELPPRALQTLLGVTSPHFWIPDLRMSLSNF